MAILKIGSLTLTFSPHRASEQLNNLLDRTSHWFHTHEWPEFSSTSVSVAGKKNLINSSLSKCIFLN